MKNLEKAFKNIPEINPSEKLGALILQKIEFKIQKEAKQKLISSYVYMFGSIFLSGYSFFVFGPEILQSEFWKLASLLFSDLQVVLANWQTFVYSLLENFPIIGVVAILFPVFILLNSLGSYFNWHARISQHIQNKKSFA